MKKVLSLVGIVIFALSLSLAAQDAEMDAEAAKAYNEGNKLLKAGNYTGAVSQYDAALATSKDYRIFYQKGVALKKLRKYDEAISAYNSGLKSILHISFLIVEFESSIFIISNLYFL